MNNKMITANSVADGRSVYLASGGVWSRRLQEGLVFAADDASGLEQALAAAVRDEGSVCGPYAIEVVVEADGAIMAASLREKIRATGPTTGHSAAPVGGAPEGR
ncbi:MAG: DUF2849 domain-containing protein [Myxococcales bacterium FL481]|nr:MAG: DUF2849 domain-containing protein [Myxococcales bacterium FL481]